MRLPNHGVEPKDSRVTLRRIRRQLRMENAFVHLLRVVTSVSNESATLEESLQATLDAVCCVTGWPVGHALLRIEDKDELVSTGLWHFDAPARFEEFRRVSEALTFGGGVGLPGRVLASGAPAWITDVTMDTNFPRNRLIKNVGLKAAFAFPILVRREVAGVLEFFNTEAAGPDERVLMVMNQVGAQVGRVIERRRAEQTLTGLAQGITARKGEDLYHSLVEHLVRSVKADCALIGELKEGKDAVRTVAAWKDGEFVPNFEYDLAGTPCESVVGRSFCTFSQGLLEKFPQDRILVDMKAQGYAGTPLFDSSGGVMGLLAAIWRRPPGNMRVVGSMVQIVGVRAAAEMELKRSEKTSQTLTELRRAYPHPVLEFSGDGTLRFCNKAAYQLAHSIGREDPIHILPKDTLGIVRKCLETRTNGVVVDALADGRTIIWSFIPILKNDSVFAHAFELTLFLNLTEEMRRIGALSRERPEEPGSAGSTRVIVRPRGKERVH